MKPPPIRLSLAGDRRFICLTRSIVRNAYERLASVNPGYSRKLIKSFNSKDRLLYNLLTSSFLKILDRKDLRVIESELNRQIIDNNLCLVENEGRLFDRSTNAVDICKVSIPSSYIFRYGMKFTVEPLNKSKLFTMKDLDLFWQDRDLNFHSVRYCGLLFSPRQQQIKLLFSHPLDLSKTWTFTLAEFQPRQILTIQKIYPCKGFYLQ